MSQDIPKTTDFVAPPLEELDHLLDGYHFESFIAKGGMGAVYLARQTSLDREVAVKVLPRELSEDEEFIKSFQTEAKLMAKLNHPNLIGIYDFGSIDGMLYIIMEFVKGKSLHHSAHGKAINQETAVEIISAVCAGLDHAHEAGILHRDIKPANILLGKNAIPKIGDFGLARVNGVTEEGVIYGTPGYAAPEVLDFPEKVDARTDIFAVGVMFYELLTGHMPEDHYVSVTEFVDADIRFDKIIKKAIHHNINMRHRSAKDFSDEIIDVIKNPSPVKKLIASGIGKNTAPVSLILKSASDSSDSGKTLTPSSSSSPSPSPVVMPLPVPADSNMMRNIIIIFLLLVAIYAVLEMTKDKKDEIAQMEEANQAEFNDKQKEKQALQAKIAEEKRRELAAKNANKKNPQNNNNNDAGPDDVSTQVSNLTPMEQLDRVQELLRNGERPMAMMPDTIFMRDQDSRIIMFIDEEMTWDEADTWAREHGGFISVCKSKSDLSVFTKEMPKDIDEVWLGAGCSGDKGWSWVDDTPWSDTIDLRPTYNREFVKLSKYGDAGKMKGDKKLTFFIEWRADGSNPAELEYRLLRTSDSLNDINPKYPPGTITLGARNYCIIKSPVTISEANELAISSAGHLIAVTNDEEKYEVEAMIAEQCKSDETFWTAAENKNNIWGWQTGEPWLKLNWAPSHPTDEKYAVITASKELLIKDVSSGTIADGFIIEWSKDKSRVKIEDLDDVAGNLNGGLEALRNQAKSLIEKCSADNEKKHAFNVKKLWSDLETYLRTLPRNQSAMEAGVINQIVAMVKDQPRVPEAIAGQGTSAKSREYTSYAVEKQAKIEQEYITQIEKLRNGYIRQLLVLKKAMEKSGQVSAIEAINEEARNIGESAADFENHLR